MFAKLVSRPAFLAAAAFAAPAAAAEPPPEMTFQLVRADAPSCAPDCPEWIAAEGTILPETAARFEAFLAGLDGRRRPVLIQSPGGAVEAAMTMGRAIRARHLAVAVAHTASGARIAPPASSNRIVVIAGPDDPFRVVSGDVEVERAYCASACSLVLAGGVERMASTQGFVGVHQVKQTLTRTYVRRRYLVHYELIDGRKVETSRDVVGEEQQTVHSTQVSPASENARIAAYLKQMGVAPKILDLMQLASPDEVHRVSSAEANETRLVTAWLEPRQPLRGRAPGLGLIADPVDPARGDHLALSAHASFTLDGAPAARVDAAFAMQPAASGVELTLALDADPALRLQFDLSPEAAALPREGSPDGRIAVLHLPATNFCRFAHAGFFGLRAPAPPTQSPAQADPRAPALRVAASAVPGISDLAGALCPAGLALAASAR